MSVNDDRQPRPSLPTGLWVQVRNTFNGQWSPGFVVDGIEDGRYRVRRARDGELLTSTFEREDLRPTI